MTLDQQVLSELAEIKTLLQTQNALGKDWLTYSDVTALYRFKESKIRSLANSGKITSKKVGKNIFFSRKSLEKLFS